MRDARDRQRAIDARLRMVAEMNHEVRNALNLIQLSAHVTHNRQSIENISSAVERIQRTLREVLGERSEQDPQTTARD